MRRLWWAFLRLFFRLLYHEFAWGYDAVAWMVSLGQWRAWGRTTTSHLQGRRVLELGHGPGHLLVALSEWGWSPVGLDLSPQMGRLARRRLQKRGLSVLLVRARAQALPFASGSFDSAVATFPTEYILDPHTLREAARSLRPGGRLVVAAWAHLTERDPLSRLVWWLYGVTGQAEPVPRGDRGAIVDAGFRVRMEWEQVGRSRVLLVVAEKGRSGGGLEGWCSS